MLCCYTSRVSSHNDLFGQETRFGRVVRWALTLLGCAQFVLSYIAIRFFFRLEAYAAGHAALPFQYRVFPMLVMRAFEHVGLLVRLGRHMPIEEPSVYALVDAGLAFAAILVALWATGKTILHLTGDRSVARWFPLLLLPMCHANLANTWGLNYTAPYDVPSVAFFAVAVWLIVTERIAWLYPVFLLATLNRETSIFLVLFYAIWQGTRTDGAAGSWVAGSRVAGSGVAGSRAAIAANIAGLGAIWLVTKLVLGRMFRANLATAAGGVVVDKHLLQNLKQIVEPQQWPVLLSVCAFALPVVWLGRRWIGNQAYTRAMTVMMVAWLLGMMVVGTIVEIRIFAEWAALLVPALAMMARNWFGRADAVNRGVA